MSNVQDLLSILGGAGGASNRPTTSRAGGVGATTSGITKTSIDAKILWSRSPRRRIIAKISLSEQESEIRISSSGIISLSLSQPEPQRVNIYSLDIQLAAGDNDTMRTHQSLSQKNSPLRSRIATTHNCNIIAPLNRVLIGEIIKAPDI